MNSISKINEIGLINNALEGLGLNNHFSIIEKVDNSIDAEASIIKIIIEKKKLAFSNSGKNVTIDGVIIIFYDNGTGMSEENGRIHSLLDLFNSNNSEGINGKYGIGAISSDKNINNNTFTLYFTKTEDSEDIQEIILDWPKLNENGWSSNVKSNNISKKNEKLINSLNLSTKPIFQNTDHGTIIINIIKENEVQKFTQKLERYIRLFHYKSIMNNNVSISFHNKINGYKFYISKKKNYSNYHKFSDNDNNIPVKFKYYNIVNWKNQIYITFDIDIYENSNGLKLYVCSYKTGNIRLKSNDNSIILRQINNKRYSQKLEVKNNIEIGELTNNFAKKTSIMYRFNIISPDNIKKTREYLLNFCDMLQIYEYTGLYFERNNRILSDPISLHCLRNTQTGNYWRGLVLWKPSKVADKLLSVSLNKSHIEANDIDKGLFRCLGLISKHIYSYYIKDKYLEVNNDDVIVDFTNCKKARVIKPNNKCKKCKNSISNCTCRKAFTTETKETTKHNQDERCNLSGRLLKQIHYVYGEYDHIDNDKSNNGVNNCQYLGLTEHRIKSTRPNLYEKIKNDPKEKEKFKKANLLSWASAFTKDELQKMFMEIINSGK